MRPRPLLARKLPAALAVRAVCLAFSSKGSRHIAPRGFGLFLQFPCGFA